MALGWDTEKIGIGLSPAVKYKPLKDDQNENEKTTKEIVRELNSYHRKSICIAVSTFIALALCLSSLIMIEVMNREHDHEQHNPDNAHSIGQVNIMNGDEINIGEETLYAMEQEAKLWADVDGLSSKHNPLLSRFVQDDKQCTVDEASRFDCWPEYKDATQDKCEKRGCCWKAATTSGAPYCFFPSNYNGYSASNVVMNDKGVTADLTRTSVTIFPPDIKKLKLQIDYQTTTRLRIRIFDPDNARFEPPVDVPSGSTSVPNRQYHMQITSSPFSIVITRASTGATIFDTSGMAPFIFADQYLQIGTKLSTRYLYGLGEHRNNFLQEISTWRKLVFWARDDPPRVDNNGYGSHPFFLNLEPHTGDRLPDAHGVLLLNSNAGEVALQPFNKNASGALTYRMTGGIFDFFVLLGPTPLSVGAQYTEVVGAPYMPPFWALGFHLCRWGYNSSSNLKKVIERNRAAQIPYVSDKTQAVYFNYVVIEQLSCYYLSRPKELVSCFEFFLRDGYLGNEIDVALQPYNKTGAITYRFTGGIMDFFVLLGDSPLSVATQYTNMIGLPYMPPFWSLGFHICKYGITDSEYLKKIISRNRAAKMPYDVQWNDIDYMDKYKDWTYSPDNYKGLPDIVKDLHDNKQKYIIMADPAISSSQPAGSYPPFDDGKKLGTFVKNSKGEILIGKVWPGETAFPDFFHPNAHTYWYNQAKGFHDKIPFDGLWIDMNEPSSFIDGSKDGCDESSKYSNPPFTPGTIDGGSLVSKTICPSAKHYLSAHYNLHNMYGWSQANISRGVLNAIYGNKRSPIISRSSFVGSGKYTGHWLGDNFSKYEDLAYSIAGILNFNLFGIPLIGADICGFLDDTNPELCTRWHQLGAFYPFMRNHADIHSKDQDPASFQKPYVDYIRKALQLRYQLLAVLYTGFFNANTKGLPIVRPMFYVYPGTEAISHQFMWIDQLLVSPVVTQGATSVTAFIPKDRFYDFYTGQPVEGKGSNVTLQAPLDTINVHIRAGSILPLLPPTERTDDSRKAKFNIVVATSPSGNASGELFWDDGVSSDSISTKKYSLVQFKVEKNTLTTKLSVSGYTPPSGLEADQITILGVDASPSQVTVNGNKATFTYDAQNKKVVVSKLSLNLLSPATVTWS